MIVYVLTVADKDGVFMASSYPTEEKAKADASYRFGDRGLCDWHRSTAGILRAPILDLEGHATIAPAILDG